MKTSLLILETDVKPTYIVKEDRIMMVDFAVIYTLFKSKSTCHARILAVN